MVCLSMVFAGAALAEMYMGVKAGYSQVGDTDVTLSGHKVGDIEFDSGWVTGIALGTTIDAFRVEGEFEYRNNDGELEIPGFGKDDGSLDTMSLLFNGYYDFQTDLGFTPYIGAGIGLARHDDDDVDDTVFAYQGTIGFALPISDVMDFDAAYRYFATEDPDFDGVEIDYDSHNITLGLRFKF